MSDPNIKLIQQGLRGLDHYRGAIDGAVGPLTRAAATAWLAAGGARAAATADMPAIGMMIHQGGARYPVRDIVVHCAATRPEWMVGFPLAAQVHEIRLWHRGKGWRDIGYHWVVGRKGDILRGRDETEIGAGVEGHNQGVIHICLVGGHGSAATDRFDRHFTRAQDVALRDLIAGIGVRTRIARISGHNEWAAKACPGFNVPNWLREAA